MNAKFKSTHAVVAGAPKIVAVMSSEAVLAPRLFSGTGAPSSSTLQTGNGKYCASTSGYVAAAGLAAAGTGYAAGNVLTASGGTATTACQITVDLVDATGAIVDWHVSTVGVYTAYPTNPVSVTGGSGSSATFNLSLQPADLYLDLTSPTAPILYVCTTAGTNSTSVWAQVSGGGTGGGSTPFKIVSDGGDYWVAKSWDGTTLGSVPQNILKPFLLRCGANKITSRVMAGVTYTYSAYTGVTVGGVTAYYTRLSSGSDGSSETQYTIPFPVANDIIYAEQCAAVDITFPRSILTAAVHAQGSGYTNNDVLTVAGGTGTSATIKLTVSGGLITAVTIVNQGAYTVAPSLSANAATGGTGSGATFDLTLSPFLVDTNKDGREWATPS